MIFPVSHLMADESALGGEKKQPPSPTQRHQAACVVTPTASTSSTISTKAALWLSSDHPLPHFRLQLRFMQIPAFLLHNLKQNVEHATIYDIHINRKHAKKLVV